MLSTATEKPAAPQLIRLKDFCKALSISRATA
jgi:hypothetical protein